MKRKLSDWQVIILLISLLSTIYMPFILSNYFQGQPYLKGDMCYQQFFIVSILEDHDWYIANNTGELNPLDTNYPFVALDKHNQLVPIHSLLFPLVTIPIYLFFKSIGLLIFNVICVLGLMVLIYCLNRLYFSKIISLITTFLYATATLFFDYVYNYSPDVFSTILIIGALLALLKKKMVFCSFMLGLAVWAKVSNMIFAPIFLAYYLFADHGYSKKIIVTSIALFFIPLFIFGWLNFEMFGSPLTTGYDRMVIHDYEVIKFTGRFSQPLFTGIYRQLFDMRNGLIPTCPILIFAFFGVFYFKRFEKKKEVIFILFLAASQFLLFSKDIHWNLSHFSNRYLMITVVLSSIFLSNLIRWGIFDGLLNIKAEVNND